MSVEFEIKAGKLIDFAKLSLASLVFASICVLFALVSGKHWVNKKKTLVCIPNKLEYTYPLVYQQSQINPPNDDAMLKQFIAKYIRLSMNEEVVDYFRVSNDRRYDKARLSKAKWEAIQMTEGIERQLALTRYSKSNEMFNMLEASNTGWTFLIDAILVKAAPGARGWVAIVYGEYQMTRDKVKTELPHQFYGYKEIILFISQQAPTIDKENGKVLNKPGLYVNMSEIRTLSAESREMAIKLNSGETLLSD